jgi:hypothetical protein
LCSFASFVCSLYYYNLAFFQCIEMQIKNNKKMLREIFILQNNSKINILLNHKNNFYND